MANLDPANAEQSTYWNGPAGERWRARQQSQDAIFTPITAALIDAAAPRPGERVIDVGCGAGETTLRAAGIAGHALGLDISEPLLSLARERAAATGSPACFEHADATTHDLSTDPADLMISRFGVMFFADPAKSFSNLRRGLKEGGRLAFVCWRAPALNPWLTLPLEAALRQLPPPPRPGPEEPGPFAFADETRVKSLLTTAGFRAISLSPEDFRLDIAGAAGLEAAVTQSLEIGPASRALTDQPEDLRQAATEEIRRALAPHLEGDAVRLPAAVWMVLARA